MTGRNPPDDVGQHAICVALPLVGDRTFAPFFERGQEMATHNVILFRLDQESGMFMRNPLDRTDEIPTLSIFLA